jgi:hypothetical protein
VADSSKEVEDATLTRIVGEVSAFHHPPAANTG